jgi:hypothetical protein
MPVFAMTDPEQLLDDIQHSVVRIIPGCDVEWHPIDVMHLIAVHCGMRHTDFLLERATVLRKQLESKYLAPGASSLLRLVLKIAMMKDYCSDFQKDLTGLVWLSLLDYSTRGLTISTACILRCTKCRRYCTRTTKAGAIAGCRSRLSTAIGDDTAVECPHSCAGGCRAS